MKFGLAHFNQIDFFINIKNYNKKIIITKIIIKNKKKVFGT